MVFEKASLRKLDRNLQKLDAAPFNHLLKGIHQEKLHLNINATNLPNILEDSGVSVMELFILKQPRPVKEGLQFYLLFNQKSMSTNLNSCIFHWILAN